MGVGRAFQLPLVQGNKEIQTPRRKGFEIASNGGKEELYNIMDFMGAAALLMNGGRRLNANASHLFKDVIVDVLGIVPNAKQVAFAGNTSSRFMTSSLASSKKAAA